MKLLGNVEVDENKYSKAQLAKMRYYCDKFKNHPTTDGPVRLEPGPHQPASPPPQPKPALDKLAMELAETLEAGCSLAYYRKVVGWWQQGTLMPTQGRNFARRLILAKARELHKNRAPHGPVQKPAAVFNWWIKKHLVHPTTAD